MQKTIPYKGILFYLKQRLNLNTNSMNTSNSQKTFKEELTGTVSEIINQLKKLVKEGNARRILIKDRKGKVLFQSQLTVGVGGAALVTAIAPVVSAIGMFALFLNDVKIIVERYPDENPGNKDEYEVDAEFIEIRDEDDANSSTKKEKSETSKTVGTEDTEE